MPMTVAVGIPNDLRTIAQDARRFEALGVDSVFVGETQHNPFLPLVLVAEHTQRMTMGTSVAIAFPRVPHITANIAWDLARYSGGRFVLGLGTQVKGHIVRRYGIELPSAARALLESGVGETVKPDDPRLARAETLTVRSRRSATAQMVKLTPVAMSPT